MTDEDKTKERIIEELAELRRQIAGLCGEVAGLCGEVAGLRSEIAELRAQESEPKPAEERMESGMVPKIGEILMAMGYMTRSQLDWSLRKQEMGVVKSLLNPKRRLLGEILIESSIVTTEQLKRALAEQQEKFDH